MTIQATQFKNATNLIRCLFWKWKARPRLPNDTEKQNEKEKKDLQKPNTTCNSHSAIISAQRCSSKILSETASSSFLLTQDSPDIPTEFFFPGHPMDRTQEGQGCPAKHHLPLPWAGRSCATSAALPQHHALAWGCWWHLRASLPSQGRRQKPVGFGQRLMPFLHTLPVTRVQEVAMGNLQTDSLIWKTHPSLTVAAGAWN